MVRMLATLMLLSVLGGCMQKEAAPPTASAAQTPTPPPPPLSPPDVGEIDRFLACSATPRRELSPREQCEIEAFKARCTALDDCYVSCISSPNGSFTGGRCAHVCTFGPHRGAPHPAGVDKCKDQPGRSGIDVETGPNNSFKPTPLRGAA